MKKIAIILIFLLISTLSFSQRWKRYRREIMAGIGTSHYFGDIGGAVEGRNSDLDIESTRLSFMIGGRYRIEENMAIKANFIYGFLKSSDLYSKNENRNYAFTGSLFETSAQFEYALVPEKPQVNYSIMDLRGGFKMKNFNIHTYLFAGLGTSFFSFKPQADLINEDIKKHSKLAIVFPLGIGFKYLIDNYKAIGIEFSGRFTTTDYLDGFTSEWSNANDVYMFVQISYVYKIKNSKRIPLF